MLSVRDLVVDIQGSRVLRGVSFDVNAGEIVCLVGRNGAGKTTTFRSIMGFQKSQSGSISFEGTPLLGLRPFQIARMGVGYAPEESEVFGELTVAENIAMPTWTTASSHSARARSDQVESGARSRFSVWSHFLRRTGSHFAGKCSGARIAEAYRVFPQLERYRARGGQALSGGERKMVSIARALALGPKLLLLDEPTEGLSPAIVPSIVEGLASIRDFGHSIFIAESNVHHVPDFTDRLYVIERGEVIFSGKPELARKDPAVARVIDGTGGVIDGGS
jgi:branched-chain amino acid transport system ATP-binding protein